jgi:cell division transport system permease protein
VMRTLRYSIGEAVIALKRGGRSALMSIGTVAVAFLTLAGFLLAVANLQRLASQVASAAEMSVFLRDAVDEATRGALAAELAAHPAVAAVDYISKDQAKTRFRSDFPELADVADTGGGNPFPASLEVRLRTDPAATAAADGLATALASRAGVADVRYDRQWLARLLAIVTGLRVVGFVVAGVLVLGAAFTVAAVVRLSLFARRDEIEIMRLVGAPFAFIRGPSIAEGTLIGGAGAALALVLLWALFSTASRRWAGALTAFGTLGDVRFLAASEITIVVVAALVVGGLTGTLVSRAVR